jgi:hypothetical protein
MASVKNNLEIVNRRLSRIRKQVRLDDIPATRESLNLNELAWELDAIIAVLSNTEKLLQEGLDAWNSGKGVFQPIWGPH